MTTDPAGSASAELASAPIAPVRIAVLWLPVVAAIVAGFGAFMPWVNVLAVTVDGISGDGRITLGAAVLAAVLGVYHAARRSARPLPIAIVALLGVAIATVGIDVVVRVQQGKASMVSDAGNPFSVFFAATVHPGTGAYTTAASGIVLALSGGYLAFGTWAAQRATRMQPPRHRGGASVLVVTASALVVAATTASLILACDHLTWSSNTAVSTQSDRGYAASTYASSTTRQPRPAPVAVGQPASDGTLVFTITGLVQSDRLSDELGQVSGPLLLVQLTIQNTGEASAEFPAAQPRLLDVDGHQFDAVDDPNIERMVPDSGIEDIESHATVQREIVFKVKTSTRPDFIRLRAVTASDGVDLKLPAAALPAPAPTTTTSVPAAPPPQTEPVDGQSCDTSVDHHYHRSDGQWLACAFAGRSYSTWVNSVPYLGRAKPGDPCVAGTEGFMSAPDEGDLVCIGDTDQARWGRY